MRLLHPPLNPLPSREGKVSFNPPPSRGRMIIRDLHQGKRNKKDLPTKNVFPLSPGGVRGK